MLSCFPVCVCVCVCICMYMHVYLCKALRANPRLGTISSLRYYYYYYYNFFIECNKRYPEELLDLHNDYLLAPEKILLDDNFKESTYRKTISDKFKEEYKIKLTNLKVPKLVSTLTNKKNYVVYAELLSIILN